MIFAILIGSLTIYYLVNTSMLLFIVDQEGLESFLVIISMCNVVIMIVGVAAYSYTTYIVRRAITKCASFDFDTRGTYALIGLYCFNFLAIVAYMIIASLGSLAIVVLVLMHYSSFLIT